MHFLWYCNDCKVWGMVEEDQGSSMVCVQKIVVEKHNKSKKRNCSPLLFDIEHEVQRNRADGILTIKKHYYERLLQIVSEYRKSARPIRICKLHAAASK